MIKLPKANSVYGASFGRSNIFPFKKITSKIHIEKIRLDGGGYDTGGAYWGIGNPLYCAWTNDEDELFVFMRATDRVYVKSAILKKYPYAKFYR